MSEVQYIKDFNGYAEKLVKNYTTTFAGTVVYTNRHRVWHLEKAMYRMEYELHTQLSEILDHAETTCNTDIDKLELRLDDMLRLTVRNWMVQHLEQMNNNNRIEKATVLG